MGKISFRWSEMTVTQIMDTLSAIEIQAEIGFYVAFDGGNHHMKGVDALTFLDHQGGRKQLTDQAFKEKQLQKERMGEV